MKRYLNLRRRRASLDRIFTPVLRIAILRSSSNLRKEQREQAEEELEERKQIRQEEQEERKREREKARGQQESSS